MQNEQVNENFDSPDFGVGYELMSALKESGVLTESRYNIMMSLDMITESRTNTPTSYVYLDRLISWEVFKAIYTDYDRYETIEDVWRGLGYPRDLFTANGKAEENMSKQLRRIANHFKENNGEAKDLLVTPQLRMKAYSKRFQNAKDENDEDVWDQPPTREDIDPGRRGRISQASRAIEKINSQDLLSGEFYSDFSRIPPSRWGSWLRFWERDKTAVQQQKRLFGRTWKKTFVLGYQVEKNLVYEIWYSSLDSSFALYDSRGNQVSRSFATLSEATKSLINAIVQSSSEDAEFFAHGINNAIAASLLRTMTGGLDQHIEDMKRLETTEQKAHAAAREAAEKKQKEDEAAKDAARAKAAASRKANWDYFKADLKNAGGRIARDFSKIATEKVGVPAADALVDKFRKGAMSLDQFLQNIADSLDLVNSPEEKDLRGALKDDEIDINDYISGIRELAAKRRADKNVARNQAQEKANKTPQAKDNTPPPKPKAPKSRPSTGSTATPTPKNVNPKSPPAVAKHVEKRKNETKKIGSDTSGTKKLTFESLVDQHDYLEAQEDSVNQSLGSDHNAIIRQMRTDATKGNYTQAALKASVNSGLISVYTETRVERNFPSQLLPRWINKGRKEPIVLPTDKPGIINRLKMLIKGVRFQADFIVGFSLADRINIEIWYITEPNPENSLSAFGATDDFSAKPAVSSFYVFDVTSGTLLRKYVPYYRNAVQIAMAKLSAQ